MIPTSAGLEAGQVFDVEPNLAADFGPERSIRWIVTWFYKHHMSDEKGAEVASRYFDALSAHSTAPEAGKAVTEFAQAILHGDDEHRAWLTDAAVAFNAGEPLPPPRGKGTALASPAPSGAASELIAAVDAGIAFGYDPATGFVHADDGGAPASCIFYVPKDEPAPSGAEPMAWRYRWKLDGEWTNWRVSDHSQKAHHLKDLEEHPLFLGAQS